MESNNIFGNTAAMDKFLATGTDDVEQTPAEEGADNQEQSNTDESEETETPDPEVDETETGGEDNGAEGDGERDNGGGEDGGEEDVTATSILAKEFGLEGQYELTEEGLSQLVKDVTAKFSDSQETDDEVREFKEWKAQGGTLEDFRRVQELQTELPLIEEGLEGDELVEAETDAEFVVTQVLTKQGIRPNVIKNTIADLKDDGKLIAEANGYISEHNDARKAEAEEVKNATKQANEKRQQEVKETWETVDKIVKQDNILGVPVPKAAMASLREAIQIDPKTGKDKLAERRKNVTVEEELLIDYLFHTDFKVVKSLLAGGGKATTAGNGGKTRTVAGKIVKQTAQPSTVKTGTDNDLMQLNQQFSDVLNSRKV